MKRTLLTISLIFIGGLLWAQDLTPPKSGAVLRIDKAPQEVNLGENTQADVWLIRSKTSSKTVFEGIKANAAPGVLVTFESHNQDKDRYVMNISVAPAVKPGKYTILLKGQGKNAHKVKGTTFSLVVADQLNANN